MDEKARRRAVTAMVDKLRADMLAAIDKMPDELGGRGDRLVPDPSRQADGGALWRSAAAHGLRARDPEPKALAPKSPARWSGASGHWGNCGRPRSTTAV